jgi:hypothetical protein
MQESDFLALRAFREGHPQGANYLLTSSIPPPALRQQERHGETIHLLELSEFGLHPVGSGISRRLRAPAARRFGDDSK